MTIMYGLHIKRKRDCIWVRLPNLIKKENVTLVENRIVSAVEGFSGDVVVDLSDTLSIFSILVTLIMKIRKKVLEAGGRFYLAHVSKKCEIQLHEMNLDKILQVFTTKEGSLQKKKRRPSQGAL